ncbi:ribosomal protein P2 [Trichoderma guizhouense]|uniref:Ribosomal protein P2 n=1 Tax=Trichoderma guizhouense TaxID=1491466 RepID=A0A1T3D1A4_9HYPO|nr:ribosomal protein P2 [Trichoderma guizhouense]
MSVTPPNVPRIDDKQSNTMPSQRPFFLSSFFNSFRQQAPSLTQQASKHTSQAAASASAVASTTAAAAAAASSSASTARAISTNAATTSSTNVAIHTPRGSPGGAIPIPGGRRRGSDSSSEGFRDALGADKWYIGGRTAAGEEKFFKLGVIRRVRSNDGLSLDRLSL